MHGEIFIGIGFHLTQYPRPTDSQVEESPLKWIPEQR
jgi:hypothetical protein